MKRFLFLSFVVAVFSLAGNSQIYHFDVNGDGVVTAADVTKLYDYLLGNLPAEPEATEYTVNGVTFKMIQVDAGTFTMGATEEQGSDAYSDESPTHQVTLSSFAIGQTEVTQELWVAVMGSNPSWFNGTGNPNHGSSHSDDFGINLLRPVECVSWNDCQVFISRLNQITGKNFRLPTEAEWEFAARGGNLSQGYKYAGSNNIDDVAWYGSNNDEYNPTGIGGNGPQTVGTKKTNELGLHDMSGNVWEWCQDNYYIYNEEAQSNPVGSVSGSEHMTRGGSWLHKDRYCRVSNRAKSSSYSERMGLRLAL